MEEKRHAVQDGQGTVSCVHTLHGQKVNHENFLRRNFSAMTAHTASAAYIVKADKF